MTEQAKQIFVSHKSLPTVEMLIAMLQMFDPKLRVAVIGTDAHLGDGRNSAEYPILELKVEGGEGSTPEFLAFHVHV